MGESVCFSRKSPNNWSSLSLTVLASMSPTTATWSPSRAKVAWWKAPRSAGVMPAEAHFGTFVRPRIRVRAVDRAPPFALGDRLGVALIGDDAAENLGADAVDRLLVEARSVDREP